MNNGDSFLVVKVWMSIGISLLAMCSPSGVSNGQILVMAVFGLVFQPLYAISAISVQGCVFIAFELFCFRVDADDPAGIIAPGFKNRKPIDTDLPGVLLVPDVADYPAALVLNLLHLHLFVDVGGKGQGAHCSFKSEWIEKLLFPGKNLLASFA